MIKEGWLSPWFEGLSLNTIPIQQVWKKMYFKFYKNNYKKLTFRFNKYDGEKQENIMKLGFDIGMGIGPYNQNRVFTPKPLTMQNEQKYNGYKVCYIFLGC